MEALLYSIIILYGEGIIGKTFEMGFGTYSKKIDLQPVVNEMRIERDGAFRRWEDFLKKTHKSCYCFLKMITTVSYLVTRDFSDDKYHSTPPPIS